MTNSTVMSYNDSELDEIQDKEFGGGVFLRQQKDKNTGNKISVNQIQSFMESFINKMDYRKDRILELEDKVEELDHSNNER